MPDCRVSIHAPLRGATYGTTTRQQSRGVFQSTRPCGARQRMIALQIDIAKVSIHAPLRGATVRGAAIPERLGFQSTRPCGARHITFWITMADYGFNPRAPAGRDQDDANICEGSRRFNPRAPAGRDAVAMHKANHPETVSIHAPLRGATSTAAAYAISSQFQSTRPCGARRPVDFPFLDEVEFQSTRPCGARRLRWIGIYPFACFNPRAPAGRDIVLVAGAWAFAGFNPRAPAGRDKMRIG